MTSSLEFVLKLLWATNRRLSSFVASEIVDSVVEAKLNLDVVEPANTKIVTTVYVLIQYRHSLVIVSRMHDMTPSMPFGIVLHLYLPSNIIDFFRDIFFVKNYTCTGGSTYLMDTKYIVFYHIQKQKWIYS